MKREYKLILVIIFFSIGLLWLTVPLKDFLNYYAISDAENELLAKIINRLVIVIILFPMVIKLGLSKFNGINREPYIKNKNVLLIPAILIVLGLLGNLTTYGNTDTKLLILFSVSVLFVGLFEEICFRGLILPLFIKSQIERKSALYNGVLYSAILFGLIHYGNLFSQPGNFWGITSQVFFGISIGVFFGALMLRTGNIFVVAVCHGFVNFILGNRILEKESVRQIIDDSPTNVSPDLVSLIATVSIFCVIILIGLNMIRRVDKTEIELELKHLKF